MVLTKIDDRGLKTPIDLKNNEKIRFGDDTALEVYNDGTNSFITNSANDLTINSTGDDLILKAADDAVIQVQGSENAILCNGNGSVELYYDAGTHATPKFATTSTGADVTGTITATAQITGHSSNSTKYVRMYGGAGTGKWDIYGHGANLRFSDNESAGNIQFDTNVGIGTTPSATLHIAGSTTTDGARIFGGSSGNNSPLKVGVTDGTEYFRVNHNGKIGIGTTDPAQILSLKSADPRILLTETTNNSNCFIDYSDAGNLEISVDDNNVDSGSKFQVRVDGASAGLTLDSSNDLTITGNLKLADGKGIDFSATSGTGTSELLDDYEEGVFTPTNSVGITLTNNNPAYYIKTGKLVHIQMDISFSGVSDSSQVGYIQSLPFTSENTTNHYAQGSIQHISENGSLAYDEDQNGLLLFIAPNESRIDIITITNSGVATRAHLEGRRFRISMFYKAA